MMVYLVYDKNLRNVVQICTVEPIILQEDLEYISCSDFDVDDLSIYNISIDNLGLITSVIKPLAERKAIQLEKENQQLGIELSEREIQEIIQGIAIYEREINEIVQGVQISDLEIQLLELQLGGM